MKRITYTGGSPIRLALVRDLPALKVSPNETIEVDDEVFGNLIERPRWIEPRAAETKIEKQKKPRASKGGKE